MAQKNNTEVRTKNYHLDEEGQVWCFTSDTAKCFVMPAGLASLRRATAAHDEALMRCTEEINALLSKVRKTKSRKDGELHLLHTPRGFLLAWAGHGVSGDDDPKDIIKAFDLK